MKATKQRFDNPLTALRKKQEEDAKKKAEADRKKAALAARMKNFGGASAMAGSTAPSNALKKGAGRGGQNPLAAGRGGRRRGKKGVTTAEKNAALQRMNMKRLKKSGNAVLATGRVKKKATLRKKKNKVPAEDEKKAENAKDLAAPATAAAPASDSSEKADLENGSISTAPENELVAAENTAQEEKRLAAEKAAEEEKRLAAEKIAAEEKKLTAEKVAAEEEKLAAEKVAAEEEKLAAEKVAAEEEKLAAAKAAAEEEKRAAEKAAEEEKRLAAEKAAEEEKRLAAEKAAEEEKRLAAEKAAEEEKRLAAEKAAEEEKRLAAEKAAEEEKRLAAEKAAEEERRLAAEKAAEEEKRLAAEKASHIEHGAHGMGIEHSAEETPPALPPNKPVSPSSAAAPLPNSSSGVVTRTAQAKSSVELPESGATRSVTVYARERFKYVRKWGQSKVRNMRSHMASRKVSLKEPETSEGESSAANEKAEDGGRIGKFKKAMSLKFSLGRRRKSSEEERNVSDLGVDTPKKSNRWRRMSAWSPSMFDSVKKGVRNRVSRSFSSIGSHKELGDDALVTLPRKSGMENARGKSFHHEVSKAKLADRAVTEAKRDAGIEDSPVHKKSHKKILAPPPPK